MSDQEDARRDEAAAWVARMQRPDAANFRSEFDAWLNIDHLNRIEFERLSERFTAAHILMRSRIYGSQSGGLPKLVLLGGLALALAAAASMLLALARMPEAGRIRPLIVPSPSQTAANAETVKSMRAMPDAIRKASLPDGTHLVLDRGAAVEVAFSERQRLIHVVKGRVRFDVEHERRPFIVTAGVGAVVAVGTMFDVDLSTDGEARVTLIRGIVDVHAKQPAGQMEVRRLKPNEQVEVIPLKPLSVVALQSLGSSDWTDGLQDVDSISLASLVAMANSRSAIAIDLADPAIGDIRVSGRFRLDRPRELASNLASLFDLEVDDSRSDRILLKKSPASEIPS